jgi:hypothetical protein
MAVADVAEGHGLARPASRGAEQVEGFLGVPQRVGGALLSLRQPGQAVMDPGLADEVAEAQCPRERIDHLRRGVEGTPFLQPRVVRRAYTGSPRAAAPALGAVRRLGEDKPGAGGVRRARLAYRNSPRLPAWGVGDTSQVSRAAFRVSCHCQG